MKSSYESGQEDSKYTDTLNQMYDTALASIHRETMKQHRKKSVFGRTADDAEPKNDDVSSTSTASSDCTGGHDEAYESFQSRDGDTHTRTSFLAGVIRESTVNLKKGVSVQLQKSWKAIRGVKPIEVFLHEARYPSEDRTTC